MAAPTPRNSPLLVPARTTAQQPDQIIDSASATSGTRASVFGHAHDWIVTPTPPRPEAVEILREHLGSVLRGFHTLMAHHADYQQLLRAPGIRLDEVPDDVEVHIRACRARAENSSLALDPDWERMERGIHGGIMRDRTRWREIHEGTPPIFEKWRTDLDAAIRAIPAVKSHLHGIVPLPGEWMMNLNAALRTIQGMTNRFHQEPWTFAPAAPLTDQVATVEAAVAILTHAIFAHVPASHPGLLKSGKTALQLRLATARDCIRPISPTLFKELVEHSSLRRSRRGERNRRFRPSDVSALIVTAERMGKLDAPRIRESWEPFSDFYVLDKSL